jgi:mRNA-degrading endonuclease RelE of RelBE toxin-antitoxin system
MKVIPKKSAIKDLEKFQEETKDVIKAEIIRLNDSPNLGSM